MIECVCVRGGDMHIPRLFRKEIKNILCKLNNTHTHTHTHTQTSVPEIPTDRNKSCGEITCDISMHTHICIHTHISMQIIRWTDEITPLDTSILSLSSYNL
eukprot:GHVR01048811.1.p2 GENE.GHVR01048811.1~~GHVR01048811.1.p2  ORF type:complete len:101 (+),score=51.63 GHVR01048811.1:99-401(+)